MRRALYVTRKFPPSVGGMETLAANVWRGISGADPGARLIAHGGSVPSTALWLPGALARTAMLVLRRRVDVVLCGDVLLYFFLGPLLRIAKVPHAVMAMGLDVTFDHPVYRSVVLPRVRRAPLVLAISSATQDAVLAAGVPRDRVLVVTLGLPDPVVDDGDRAAAGSALRERFGVDASTPLLVTVGRLVPRKGVAWFVSEVMALLDPELHLVVAGDGPDRERIEVEVHRRGLGGRVHMLGRVSDPERDQLMTGADVFVQPNVVVPGDMEGFGLVAVEAAMRGAVVVAADLEGLADAVQDGVTGDLVPSGDADAWAEHLRSLVADGAGLSARGARYRAACRRRSSLDVMAGQLLDQLDAVSGRPAVA